MPKYQREHQEEELETLRTPVQDTAQEEVASTPEEETFKKRYGDLRRHTQQKDAERDGTHQKELESLRRELDEATKKQIKFPKTEAEVSEWTQKYPDVAKIIQTIAGKQIQEARAEAGKEIDRISEQQAKTAHTLTKREALAELKRLQPEFERIKGTKKFHDWVSEQPTTLQDSIYKRLNPVEASRTIDLYKSDMGMRSGKSSATESAAKAVSTGGGGSPSTTGAKQYSESQVDRMSLDEYEKNAPAIKESMRKGTFVYDISGGAR
tara:strand:- start:7269 stop:8066 length:798 start_codon:yes stop_codon:yes gene_type:complete